MFPPTNESYVQFVVESTIDRHMGETDEERTVREGNAYNPGRLSNAVFNTLHALGQVFLAAGHWLENLQSSQSTTKSDVPPMGTVAHGHSR